MLTYAWRGFVQTPLVETPAAQNLISDVICAAVAVALVGWVWTRQMHREPLSAEGARL